MYSDIFPVILTDWQQKPRFIEQIPVPEIKEWALGMNNMIYNLARYLAALSLSLAMTS